MLFRLLILKQMIERDQSLSVYMGNFIAIPHGTEEAKKLVKKSGIGSASPEGVNFGTEEDEKLLPYYLGLPESVKNILQLVQQIALYCSDMDNVVQLADVLSKEEITENLAIVKGENKNERIHFGAGNIGRGLSAKF